MDIDMLPVSSPADAVSGVAANETSTPRQRPIRLPDSFTKKVWLRADTSLRQRTTAALWRANQPRVTLEHVHALFNRRRRRFDSDRTGLRAREIARLAPGRGRAAAGGAEIADPDFQRDGQARGSDADPRWQGHPGHHRPKRAGGGAGHRDFAGARGRQLPGAMERPLGR